MPVSKEDYLFYKKYIVSPEWESISKEIKLNHDNQCDNCGTSERLEVHHDNYEHLGNELDHLETVSVLCRQCHQDIHEILKDIKRVEKIRSKEPKRDNYTCLARDCINGVLSEIFRLHNAAYYSYNEPIE